MNTRRTDAVAHTYETLFSPEEIGETTLLDICTCIPLDTSTPLEQPHQPWNDGAEEALPVSSALLLQLQEHMHSLLADYDRVSVLLLHISQLENVQMMVETGTMRKRVCYHSSLSVMEQILTNVRRAVRTEDAILLDRSTGAALFFPNVDQQGAYTILERVFNSVNLLQAETIVPPLAYETNIVLGVGSFPEQGHSVEQVLAHAGQVMYHLTLRPAITTNLWDSMPLLDSDIALPDTSTDEYIDKSKAVSLPALPLVSPSEGAPIPFLQLPEVVSRRMKSLVPYTLAAQFRCLPVGRDHNRLTMAMSDPTDAETISMLTTCTGMSIFPVSCDKNALNGLLEEPW